LNSKDVLDNLKLLARPWQPEPTGQKIKQITAIKINAARKSLEIFCSYILRI
jgi:hypothetical protein